VASRLNPYISFTDNARQAMEFYEGVFGGTLMLRTFGSSAHRTHRTPRRSCTASWRQPADSRSWAPTPVRDGTQPGNNIAVSLSGDDADELRGYWEKLSDGGTVSVPLEKQMWGMSSACAWTGSASAGWSTSASRRPDPPLTLRAAPSG